MLRAASNDDAWTEPCVKSDKSALVSNGQVQHLACDFFDSAQNVHFGINSGSHTRLHDVRHCTVMLVHHGDVHLVKKPSHKM